MPVSALLLVRERGQPVILENEVALQEEHASRDDEEDDSYSHDSSDDVIAPPAAGERERLLREPPPDYRLPPLYTPRHTYHNPHAR